jgi:hypothetical protein
MDVQPLTTVVEVQGRKVGSKPSETVTDPTIPVACAGVTPNPMARTNDRAAILSNLVIDNPRNRVTSNERNTFALPKSTNHAWQQKDSENRCFKFHALMARGRNVKIIDN